MDSPPDQIPETTPERAAGNETGQNPRQSPGQSPGQFAGGDGPQPDQRLHRAARGRMVAGVAGGVADYFAVDPTIVRIGFVALAILGGLAVPLYVAGWLMIPDEGNDLSVAEELLAREQAQRAY